MTAPFKVSRQALVELCDQLNALQEQREREREVLRVIIEVLSCPRDRYRRLEVPIQVADKLRTVAKAASPKLPHGGLDTLDQVSMVLQSLLGETPKSVLGEIGAPATLQEARK